MEGLVNFGAVGFINFADEELRSGFGFGRGS